MTYLLTLLIFFTLPSAALAADATVGTVQDAAPAIIDEIAGMTALSQDLTLETSNGAIIQTTFNDIDRGSGVHPLTVGDRMIVQNINGELHIGEHYRLPALGWIVLLFVSIATLVAGPRVWRSLAALTLALGILVTVFAPLLLAGYSPLLVAGGVGTLIAAVTFFVGHGFRRVATLGLIATIATLGLAIGLANFAVWLTQLSGAASEEALYLSLGTAGGINMHGLLLAGMLIGTLGVLDDVTMAQIEIVATLKKANMKLSRHELFVHAMRVGRTHIASVINTLALAYAGSSLPLFLLFQLMDQPVWLTLNSEFVVEELVRMLVGSSAIILAIPIATLLATASSPEKYDSRSCGHTHKT